MSVKILTTIGGNGIDIKRNASLSDFTTFRLGGRCPALISCQTPQQLTHVVEFLNQENTDFILIGGGSNLLVSDLGVDCCVIRYVSEAPIIERDGNDVIVSASTALDDLAKYAAENGLEGLNQTTGIPGTVGGAIVGNAGAFGRQIGDAVKEVNVLCRARACVPCTIPSSELDFSYRYSILKETSDIVVSVRVSLKPGDQNALLNEREEILTLRHEKHPDLSVYPCAGSFFRNIEPTSNAGRRQAAGWFLEHAGAKDFHCGGARIFEKHANIIVKGSDCYANDVFDLSQKMQAAVRQMYGFDLVREVRFLGIFNGDKFQKKDVFW